MPADGPLPYDIIDTPSDLETLAAALEQEPIMGVDLEADSMYHFQEKVCLIQLATARRNAIIDTIAVRDLAALKPVFRNPDIRKVFHGADYDVRSLYRDFDIRIHTLFDTRTRLPFPGNPRNRPGSGVEEYLWCDGRQEIPAQGLVPAPLPKDMLAYAAGDVRYLVPLAQKLEAELEAKGRLGWVSEECRLLSKVRPAANSDQPLFLSFKGAGRLDPRSLAVLAELRQRDPARGRHDDGARRAGARHRHPRHLQRVAGDADLLRQLRRAALSAPVHPRHLIEQPMLAVCSAGPRPLRATSALAS